MDTLGPILLNRGLAEFGAKAKQLQPAWTPQTIICVQVVTDSTQSHRNKSSRKL